MSLFRRVALVWILSESRQYSAVHLSICALVRLHYRKSKMFNIIWKIHVKTNHRNLVTCWIAFWLDGKLVTFVFIEFNYIVQASLLNWWQVISNIRRRKDASLDKGICIEKMLRFIWERCAETGVISKKMGGEGSWE